jgi:cell wall-associated NlpC family hydrolase
MSMNEIIGRIGTIQSMIDQLSRPIATTTAPSASTAAASAAAFDAALTAAGVTNTGGTASGVTAASGAAGLTGLSGLTGLAGPLSATATQVPSGAATGTDVVAAAKKYIGVPYVWGGTNPATGMDCSGFVQRVFKDLGVEIPRVVSDQMKVGTPVASLAEAKPGDLLVSFGGEHISIYLGNGKAIDAPVPGQTIQIRDAWEQQSNLTAIRRIVPAGQGGA